MAERQPRSERLNQKTVPCDLFISRAAPQRGLKNLVLLLVIVFFRAPVADIQVMNPTRPAPLMSPKKIKDYGVRQSVRLTVLKSLRKMKTHTRNPYEANFTEDGKPDSEVRFCARFKCFVATFHLPSLDAL